VFDLLSMEMIGLILLCGVLRRDGAGAGRELQIDQLNRLADKAAEVVEVTLDERRCRTCGQVSFTTINPDEAKGQGDRLTV